MLDTFGHWWTGDDFADLAAHIRIQTEGSYRAERIVQSSCRCGATVFEVWADDAEGCARRVCISCGMAALIGDSEGYWQEAEPEQARCPCGQAHYEVGVGFSFRATDPPEVKWITIGIRCIHCGIVGSLADWKIDYAPTDHLLALA